jgi:hypothetical protein
MCLSYPALPIQEVRLAIVRRAVEASEGAILPDILSGWGDTADGVVVEVSGTTSCRWQDLSWRVFVDVLKGRRSCSSPCKHPQAALTRMLSLLSLSTRSRVHSRKSFWVEKAAPIFDVPRQS